MIENPMSENPMMEMNLMNNEDDDWLKGFKQGIEEINKTSKKFIYNILFKTTSGKKTALSLDSETTSKEMINQYFNKIEKHFLLKDMKKKAISFLFNAREIIYDNEKIENIFRENNNPIILVHDKKNII